MRTIALTAGALLVLAGCAAMKPTPEAHAAHHPPPSPAAPAGPAARMDAQMKTMQEMHQKMMAAKTPQERQALMAEHMKAMQGGMTMMCEMGQAPAASASPPAQPGMGMGMGMGAGQPDMMQRCMAMRDMTLRMMMDREAAPPK